MLISIRFVPVLAMLALPLSVPAQSARAVVELDHATGRAKLIVTRGAGADTTQLDRDPVVRLPRSVPVEVRVVNTNTAFYAFRRETEAIPLPETQMVRSFMGRAAPFVPDARVAVTSALRGRGAGQPDPSAVAAARTAITNAAAKVGSAMDRMDRALYGPEGLQDNLTTALLALERMRRGDAPEQASRRIRESTGRDAPCGAEAPVRLRTAEELLTALFDLVHASQELRALLAAPMFMGEQELRALRDSSEVLDRRVQSVLLEFEPLIANAYRVERLVGQVAAACSQWSAGVSSGTRTTGRTVIVHVTPRPEPEVARLADRAPRTFRVAIQPQYVVRPGMGLGFIVAPAGRLPNYGTRPVGDAHEVIEMGTTDARFSPAGSLGLTWPWLDRRDTHGLALWLPEVTVAAGGRVTAFGVGPAVSWNFLKVGAGALWIKHPTLDGSVPGEMLSDPGELRRSDAYGTPKLYLSVSVFDWSPLAERLGR